MSNRTNALVATIGTYTLAEDTDFHPLQEFAGAEETIRVPAGVYPVEVRRSRYSRKLYVSIALPGICTYRGWFGTNTRVERPMTPDTHRLSPYAYQLDTMDRVTLDDPNWRENLGEYCG